MPPHPAKLTVETVKKIYMERTIKLTVSPENILGPLAPMALWTLWPFGPYGPLDPMALWTLWPFGPIHVPEDV